MQPDRAEMRKECNHYWKMCNALTLEAHCPIGLLYSRVGVPRMMFHTRSQLQIRGADAITIQGSTSLSLA